MISGSAAPTTTLQIGRHAGRSDECHRLVVGNADLIEHDRATCPAHAHRIPGLLDRDKSAAKGIEQWITCGPSGASDDVPAGQPLDGSLRAVTRKPPSTWLPVRDPQWLLQWRSDRWLAATLSSTGAGR
ncbi:MAG: hypothetical protein R2710_30475 [Acidimicrobiales bacterium]